MIKFTIEGTAKADGWWTAWVIANYNGWESRWAGLGKTKAAAVGDAIANASQMLIQNRKTT